MSVYYLLELSNSISVFFFNLITFIYIDKLIAELRVYHYVESLHLIFLFLFTGFLYSFSLLISLFFFLFFFLEGDAVCNVVCIFLASYIWPWSICPGLQWKLMPSRSISILHNSLDTIISIRFLNYLLLLSSYSYDAFTNASAHWWIYFANPILDASTEWEFLMNHRVSSFPFF